MNKRTTLSNSTMIKTNIINEFLNPQQLVVPFGKESQAFGSGLESEYFCELSLLNICQKDDWNTANKGIGPIIDKLLPQEV